MSSRMFRKGRSAPWLLAQFAGGAVGLLTGLVLMVAGPGLDPARAIEPFPSIAHAPDIDLCVGDCDDGQTVAVNELVTLVNIALEQRPPTACAHGVPPSGTVNVAAIVEGVNNALDQCRPRAHLSQGALRGEYDGGSRRFLGVPYAAPPVGDLRWRPPQPPVSWTGVRRATSFGASCAEISGGSAQFSEDCLYLNVWTPNPIPDRPLPVMVWFHGGGNQVLSASATFFFSALRQYNGRTLAETRDVIVVTVNYRLGVFGFFPHPALADEDPAYPYAGNQGLLDQRAALEWVRDNIVAFGGDPENVTIFGESAGGYDVCLHMVSPGSAGLFHRAISQSNGCTLYQRRTTDAVPLIDDLVSSVGCDGSGDVLSCLRAVAATDLLHTGALRNGWEGV